MKVRKKQRDNFSDPTSIKNRRVWLLIFAVVIIFIGGIIVPFDEPISVLDEVGEINNPLLDIPHDVKVIATDPFYVYPESYTITTGSTLYNFDNLDDNDNVYATLDYDTNLKLSFKFVSDIPALTQLEIELGESYYDLDVYFSHNGVIYDYLGEITGYQTVTFNVDVLDDDMFYVRFIDQSQSDNGIEIDFLRFVAPNQAPNSISLTCDSIIDSYLYSMHGATDGDTYAVFTLTGTDTNGASDITQLTLEYEDEYSDTLWKITWDASTSFSEYDPDDNILFSPALSTVSINSFAVTIDFYVRINWNHEKVFFTGNVIGRVFDSENNFGSDNLPARIRTDLYFSSGTSTTSRTNKGGTAEIWGVIKYLGSDITPYSNAVDIRMHRVSGPDGDTGTSWEYTTDPDTNGYFSGNTPVTSTVGTNILGVQVLIQDTTTQLLYDTTETITEAIDSNVILNSAYYSPASGEIIDIGTNTTIQMSLEYESDGSTIPSGSTVTYSSTGDTLILTYNGVTGFFEGTAMTKSSLGSENYSVLTITTPDGITLVNGQPIHTVYWDTIAVSLSINDTYVNVGDTVTITATAYLVVSGVYLDSTNSDTLSLNIGTMNYDNSNKEWTLTISYDIVTMKTFTLVASLSTGFNTMDSNPTVNCTWNALMYSLSVDDSIVDGIVWLIARVTRTYDGTTVNAGTVEVTDDAATPNTFVLVFDSVSQRWNTSVTHATLGIVEYHISYIYDSTYDLSSIGEGMFFDGTSYVDCGNSSTLDLTSSMTISVRFSTTSSSGTYYILSRATTTDIQYALYINSGVLKYAFTDLGGTLNIIDLQTSVSINVWHHATLNFASNGNIELWYDGSPTYSRTTTKSLKSFPTSTLYIGSQNNISDYFVGLISEISIYAEVLTDTECYLLYQGLAISGDIRLQMIPTSFSLSNVIWNDLSTYANHGNLNDVTLNTQTEYSPDYEYVCPLWDRVIVIDCTHDTDVVNLASTTYIHVKLNYEYSGVPLTRYVTDGTVSINGFNASYSGVNDIWNVAVTESIVGAYTFDSVLYSNGAYNLSIVNQNMVSTTIIFEQIIITSTTVVNVQNILGQQAEIRVTARLTYFDTHYLSADDVLHMNGIEMQWNSSGSFFYYNPTQFTTGIWNYRVNLTNAYESTYGITSINLNGTNVDVIWVYDTSSNLYLEATTSSVLVSTLYDTQSFVIDIWLTNVSGDMISGWINITIGGTNYSVFCDGVTNISFSYFPQIAGDYSIQVTFEGDINYDYVSENLSGLTAILRSTTFDTDFETTFTGMMSEPFRIFNVHDNDFLGTFQDIVYIYDYPINSSFAFWWTLSLAVGAPKTYVGSWSITDGSGKCTWALPWDLNGDNQLTDDDFSCYIIFQLDGQGVYEDIEISLPVNIIQLLEIDLQVSLLTYSDPATFTIQLSPLFDPLFIEHLSIDVNLYVSYDNSSWTLIDVLTTNANGFTNADWICYDSLPLFFKAAITSTVFYSDSVGFTHSTVSKENTVLTIVQISNLTYSDSGVIIAQLVTDDGEPISDYPVYLEIFDQTWISIGDGLVNATGYVNVLWTPDLPSGTYSIRVRAFLTESDLYSIPDYAVGHLVINKETLVILLDTTTYAQGYVVANLTDDEGNPVSGVSVCYYIDDHETSDSVTTNDDGIATLLVNLEDGQRIRVSVIGNEYYNNVSLTEVVFVPPDPLQVFVDTIPLVVLGLFSVVAIAFIKKNREVAKTTTTTSPAVLRAEDEDLEEGFEKTREKLMATLDGSKSAEEPESD